MPTVSGKENTRIRITLQFVTHCRVKTHGNLKWDSFVPALLKMEFKTTPPERK